MPERGNIEIRISKKITKKSNFKFVLIDEFIFRNFKSNEKLNCFLNFAKKRNKLLGNLQSESEEMKEILQI